MGELFASGIKIGFLSQYCFILVNHDENYLSKIQRNRANCETCLHCIKLAMYDKNISVLLHVLLAECLYAFSYNFAKTLNPFSAV